MRRRLILQLIVLILVGLGYLVLYLLVPRRCCVERDWGVSGVNWFGQGQGITYLYGLSILAPAHWLRYLLTTRAASAIGAIIWYCLLLLSPLPLVWLLVVMDSDVEGVSETACWVGVPISLLFVPTAVLFDLISESCLSTAHYAARSITEWVVLVPTWAIVWGYCMLLLGWIGV